MCGIAGILHFDADRLVNRQILSRMSDTMIHRGPDGSGYFLSGNVGLAHRRLSIIDLETGSQPQFNEQGTVAIVFNGEIYNYLELRNELKSLGYRFKTNSDTEVIIHAYEQWGENCQDRLNGMWAFALWDETRKKLFLSRDRLGEKPLFYSTVDNTFIFASEPKALLAYGVPFHPNVETTELFLSLGYIPAPFCYYRKMLKLQPGHSLTVQQGTVREARYWDIPDISNHEFITDERYVTRMFQDLFENAVHLRMRSDVPFGAFLSGGLDSGSVVAAMAGVSSHPIHTYTIGFENPDFDERSLARDVAEKFRTHHTEEIVKPASFDHALHMVLNHFDEPFGDSSAIPTGYVSKMASQHVRMVLTGDGGDEVLSGYNSYQIEKFAMMYGKLPGFITKVLPALVGPPAHLTKGAVRYKLNRLKRILEYANLSFEDRLQIKSSWFPPVQIKKLVEGLGPQIGLNEFINTFYNGYRAKDPFYKLMHFHLKVQLPDDFLVKVDRMSMAYSLETRVPFLDYRLVEFMSLVSKKIKMKGLERKSILRNSIGKKLPPSLLRARKRGFTPPVREWFKDPAFESRFKPLQNSTLLNKRLLQQAIHENQMGQADWGNFIWMAFVLHAWFDRHTALPPQE